MVGQGNVTGNGDPTMPALMPPAVEQALAEVLGFRGKANPVELYDAIRAELERLQPPEQGLMGDETLC